MRICIGIHSRNNAVVILICASLFATCVSTVRAQDPADKANSLLDNLKKRSPEERWQRVKKQYAVDPETQRRKASQGASENSAKGLADDELPPSPQQQTQLIPRLTALPVDTSNDWVLPARDPELIEELSAELPQQPTDPFSSKPAEPQPVRTDADTTGTTARENMKAGPAGDVIVGDSRPPTERKITDINPYYDRKTDGDIREFAVVKGREFGLQFRHKTYAERSFPDVVLAWEASNYFYHPLYFQDPALERYGHSCHPVIQPIVSIARFGTQFVLLPYQMTIEPVFMQSSPLGWYRPGDVTPKLHYQIPLNAQAAVVEAAAIAGLYFAIP